MYAAALLVSPVIGALVRPPHSPLSAATLRLLPPILLVVSAADYVISLLIEASIVTSARRERNPAGAAAAVVITGALGLSIGLNGLILALLGASGWSLPFYALAFVHGAHLAIRWPSLEQVAAGGSYDTEP